MHKEAYKKVQQVISQLPTMKAPIHGWPLKIYLAYTTMIVGALLAQENYTRQEHTMYYVSR